MPDTIRRNEHTKIIKDGRKEKKKKKKKTPDGLASGEIFAILSKKMLKLHRRTFV